MIGLLIVTGLGSLTGCTNGTTVNTTSDSKGVMSQQQVLNLATTQPLTTLDTDRMTQFGRLNNTIEGLYQTAQNGQTQLALAQKVKINAAKTTYTFTLWKDSHWSNGDLITAHDFVYAWRRALAPMTKAPEADLFQGIKNARAILAGNQPATQLGVHAQGRFKLIVHLDHPMAELPQRFAYPLFGPQNARIAHRFGAKYATKPQYQVYAGPFMVSQRGDTAKHWHMVPNPHYWDRKHVYLTRINVKVYPENKQTWRAYQDGKLDEVRLLTKNNIQQYEHRDGYTARPYSRMITLSYRQTGPKEEVNQLLTQRLTRLALSHAIDRHALGKNTYGITSLPAQGIVPAGLSRGLRGTADFAAAQTEQQTLAYHPKLAQKQWQSALKRAGIQRVTLSLGYRDAPYSNAVAKLLQKQLTHQLPGLSLHLIKYRWSTNHRQCPMTADLNLGTVRAQYADPLAMLALFTSHNSANTGHWSNETYDQLVEKASNAPAFNSQRWQTLLRAEAVLMRDQGVTPLFQPASTYLVNPHLNGVQFNTVGTQSNFKQAYFVK